MADSLSEKKLILQKHTAKKYAKQVKKNNNKIHYSILISGTTVYVTEYPVKTNAGKVKTVCSWNVNVKLQVTFVVKRMFRKCCRDDVLIILCLEANISKMFNLCLAIYVQKQT